MSEINTVNEYKEILKKVSVLIDKDPDKESKEGKELEELSLLIEDYEKKHYPIEK